MTIYMRLKTADGKLLLEQVNQQTYDMRAKAIDEQGEQRYVVDEFVKIAGSQVEIKLNNLNIHELGWIARLLGITIPNGSNNGFVAPIGPVRFKQGKQTVMITPAGEIFTLKKSV